MLGLFCVLRCNFASRKVCKFAPDSNQFLSRSKQGEVVVWSEYVDFFDRKLAVSDAFNFT